MRGALQQSERRERSNAQIAFAIMRVLATRQVLWGEGGGLPLSQVTGVLGAPAAQIACVLGGLHGEGIVRVTDDTVELTERGAHELVGRQGGGPGNRRLDRHARAAGVLSERATGPSGLA